MDRIALGTVQFGLDYGVANRQGPVPIDEIKRILAVAGAAGMNTLDTAIAYGDSEARLGQAGAADWRIVSKLPGLSPNETAIGDWITTQATASLGRLATDHLDAFLLHHPGDLLGPSGSAIYEALQGLKSRGITKKIGVSVYGPDELNFICSRFSLDVVQIPFNIIDRRLTESGSLKRLNESGIEIHARSVFLQGLLLMIPAWRPPYFSRWQPLWARWHQWLADTGVAPLAACLRFALAESGIARVIVGVDSLAQLKEILAAVEGPMPPLPTELRCDDSELINPSHWQLRT